MARDRQQRRRKSKDKNTKQENGEQNQKEEEGGENGQEEISAFEMRERQTATEADSDKITDQMAAQEIDVRSLSNEVLGAKLRELGVNVGPLVGSSRAIHERKLLTLLGGSSPSKTRVVKRKSTVHGSSQPQAPKSASRDGDETVEIDERKGKGSRAAVSRDRSAETNGKVESIKKRVKRSAADNSPLLTPRKKKAKRSDGTEVGRNLDETFEVSDCEDGIPKAEAINKRWLGKKDVLEVRGKLESAQGFDPFEVVEPMADEGSLEVGTRVLSLILRPLSTEDFLSTEGDIVWGERPMIIRRTAKNYFKYLFGTEQFFDLLRRHPLLYTENINIASYVDGIRRTLNGEGRADLASVQHHISNGCSVQLVNPQAYSDSIWAICDVLQEVFDGFVGANTYLTPAESAGFAPHWDDIDAFICQVEGTKHWALYKPKDPDFKCPRESSGNLTVEELVEGTKDDKWTLVFDDWLDAGDLLYIPRGVVHMANTKTDRSLGRMGQQSLHVTISVCRQSAYGDLLEALVPQVLESVIEDEVIARSNLPLGLFRGRAARRSHIDHTSCVHEYEVTMKRLAMVLKKKVIDFGHAGVDMMARKFMRTALPPYLTREERKLSVYREGAALLPKIHLKTQIRFVRYSGQRLILESEEQAFVVHRMANSRFYEGKPEKIFDLDMQLKDGYMQLMKAYPNWVAVGDLKCESDQLKKELAELLFSNGVALIK